MSTEPLRIAIAGASGRMGQMLVEAVLTAPDMHLAGALDMPGSPALGRDAGAFLGKTTGVAVTSGEQPCLGFTVRDVSRRLVNEARTTGTGRGAMAVGAAGMATVAAQAAPAIQALGGLAPMVAIAVILAAILGVLLWRLRQPA